MNNCKKCQSDQINVFIDSEVLNYKGVELVYDIEYSVCQVCQREFISTAQIKSNDCRVREIKKKHDGLLSAHLIKEIRQSLNLTQEQASLVFGGGKNAFSKYERAEVAQSKAMDKLIRICKSFPEVFNSLLTSEGIMVGPINYEYSDNIIDHPQKLLRQGKLRITKEINFSEQEYG